MVVPQVAISGVGVLPSEVLPSEHADEVITGRSRIGCQQGKCCGSVARLLYRKNLKLHKFDRSHVWLNSDTL